MVSPSSMTAWALPKRVEWRKCSLAAFRPTGMPSTLSGFSLVRSGLPRWTKLSPILKFTPANVCSPVGTAARLLFGIRPPTSSASFWLALPCRSMNEGPLVFGAGAARQAAATQAAATVPRDRDTGGPPTTGRAPDYPRTGVRVEGDFAGCRTIRPGRTATRKANFHVNQNQFLAIRSRYAPDGAVRLPA